MQKNHDEANFPAQLIQLFSSDGGLVKISPYGAHVLSWVPGDGLERLFLSPKAEFRRGAAIRGGVPFVFPQFSGMGELPKHGFARTQIWEVTLAASNRAVFRLADNIDTRRIWPHRFLIDYTIRIDNMNLELSMSVTNIDQAPLIFTAALHTYLHVDEISKASIVGLKGTTYRDSDESVRMLQQEQEQVSFDGELDRIYLNAPTSLALIDGQKRLMINSINFPDAVIWNPGQEKCSSMSDMEPQGYRKFVCVEAAAIGQALQLEPGGNWLGKQVLSI